MSRFIYFWLILSLFQLTLFTDVNFSVVIVSASNTLDSNRTGFAQLNQPNSEVNFPDDEWIVMKEATFVVANEQIVWMKRQWKNWISRHPINLWDRTKAHEDQQESYKALRRERIWMISGAWLRRKWSMAKHRVTP